MFLPGGCDRPSAHFARQGSAEQTCQEPAAESTKTSFDSRALTYWVGQAQIANEWFFPRGRTTVRAVASDIQGNIANASFVIEVLSSPPVAEPGGPYTVQEGGSVLLDASASADPDPEDSIVAYAWDLDNDGQFDDAFGATPSTSWPDGPLVQTIRLRVTSSDGGTGEATSTVTVTSAAPTATITPLSDGFQGVSGQMRSFVVTATDASPGDQAGKFTYFIDWGDVLLPNLVEGPSPLTVSHAFSRPGAFAPTVYAVDKDSVAGPSAGGPMVNILTLEKQGPVWAVSGTPSQEGLIENTLVVAQVSSRTFAITSNSQSRGRVTLASGERIRVFFGSVAKSSDQIKVNGTPGADQFLIGDQRVTLNGVAIEFEGAEFQRLDGAAGTDTLTGANAGNTWQLVSDDFGGLGFSWVLQEELVAFQGMEKLVGGSLDDHFVFDDQTKTYASIDGAGGTDRLDYSELARAANVNVGTSAATAVSRFANIEAFAGNGQDRSTIRGGNGTNVWTIDGPNSGTINGRAFSGFTDLIGGRGGDTFRIGAAGSLSGRLDGGGGSDVLDYASRSAGVTVNLAAGTATALGRVANLRALIGTAFADVLTAGPSPMIILGGAGDDLLQGGNGRDLLVGGSGADILRGGGEEDILFGGTITYYDEDSKAVDLRSLDSVLQQWNAGISYSSRIARLAVRINPGTFRDDAGAADQLYGEGGMDWYLRYPGDTVDSPEPGETVDSW